jgi:uncharacterized protein
MLNKDNIMKIAGEKKLNPSAISKDYALGWLLFGISESSIGDKLIFKGGTALSKVHFPEGWRLSEDLDFTLVGEITLEVLEKALKEEIPKIIMDAIGMEVKLKDRPHANEGFYQSRFQYTGPLGKDTVKIEITKEEVLRKADVKKMPKVFDYPAFDVNVYPLEEILAEKMRAILQRKTKKIRDYYDVWRLLKTTKFDGEKVKTLFLEKCKGKGITYADVNQFFPDGIVKTLEPHLETGLTRLSREPMPSLDDMINELRKSLEEFLK